VGRECSGRLDQVTAIQAIPGYTSSYEYNAAMGELLVQSDFAPRTCSLVKVPTTPSGRSTHAWRGLPRFDDPGLTLHGGSAGLTPVCHPCIFASFFLFFA
jgi:hypothetical protein